MKPTLRWFVMLVSFVALLTAGWLLLFRKSDAAAIRQRLDRLASAVQVNAADSPLARYARINEAFKDLMVKEVIIEIPELTFLQSGRRELVQVATQAGSVYQRFDVSFSHLEIEVAEGKAFARVGATAGLRATRADGSDERDDREVTFLFDKSEGDWKIRSITVSSKAPRA
ncbi:MAG: hypothetical protein NVS3B20_17700 [Polyangiales bacterium]